MGQRVETLDEFGSLIIELVKKGALAEGLFNFIQLSERKGVDIREHVLFIGEYQALLWESIALQASYLLFDKVVDEKSRMQIELDVVVDKLRTDIDNHEPSENFTVEQKRLVLEEIQLIRENKEYRRAINAVKNARNQYVAHRGRNAVINLTYSELQLVVKNMRRCFEIRELVLRGVGKQKIITDCQLFDHRNLVEALLIQKDVCSLREYYNCFERKPSDKRYSSDFDYWRERLMPTDLPDGWAFQLGERFKVK
ncbi:MAG: hypothetical protein FWF59_03360 [Turicibacter sp.]|nr:hypothetical protein [Turicibacter sp.]